MTTRKKKSPEEMLPEIEPIASKFLAEAVKNNFVIAAKGSEIAHVAAMQLSVATSMKRIADVFDGMVSAMNKNDSIETSLLDIKTSFHHLNDILARPKPVELSPEELGENFYPEGKPVAFKESALHVTDDFPDTSQEAIQYHFGRDMAAGRRTPGFWERFLDLIAPRTRAPKPRRLKQEDEL